jgi:ribosomal protein S18 acetylase RimI-like enzyme
MNYTLRNGKSIEIRLLENGDHEKLYIYFQILSQDSRSRFGPHPFDRDSVNNICLNPNGETVRYIALDNKSGDIVAYMLTRQGMIEWDEKRYAERNQFYDHFTSVTYAPSVADAWQSSGLGSLMNHIIEEDLKKKNIKNIILWGGVQASNEKAVNFYKKLGYQHIASFWHDGKYNDDMVKRL